jgi:predicted ATPase/DNA-binding winged helix-turn-helix (wHTH) protein
VSADSGAPLSDAITFGPYRLSPAERLLERDDSAITIGSRALDILIALIERPGEIVSHRDLMRRVWPNMVVEEANLRVHVGALRKVLRDGDGGIRYIANIPGRGYCFVAPVQRPAMPDTQSLRPAPERLSIPNHNLPPRLSRMIGRGETIAALLAMLASHRFVSVIGPGGMGKTTVAISVAHELLSEFGNAIFFVDLASINEDALVPTAVTSVLGVRSHSPDPLPDLLAFLARQRVLLVLDNCEHVIAGAAALTERLYSEAPNVHLLTTSRESLRVEGEHVHLLRPLDHPPHDADITTERILAAPAVQLFMERAAASGFSDPLSDDDARIVTNICRKLDGIALAIELVASRIGTYGIRGTEELLNNRFKLLWQGRRGALPRHQTLHAMLDWSFNLLSAPDRQLLCRLAIFVGAFTLDAAQSVAADPILDSHEVANSLNALVEKSLICSSTIDNIVCFRLLDTTRSYAAAKLVGSDCWASIARQHALHCSQALRMGRVDLAAFGGRDLSGFVPLLGDIRAALEWSFSSVGHSQIGVDLAALAVPLLLGLSLLSECQRWCQQGLAALAEADQGTETELALQQALAISSMFTRGISAEVRAAIERGLRLAERLGDRKYQLHLLVGLHIILINVGDFREALIVSERSVTLATELESATALTMADWMLGFSYHLVGNQEAAQRYCDSGFARAAASGLVEFFGFDHRVRALIVFARVSWLRGYPDRAVRMSRRAISEAEQSDRPINLCIALMYAATVYLWNGDFENAEYCIERLIAHVSKFSLVPYRGVGVALKGELAIARGELGIGVYTLKAALRELQCSPAAGAARRVRYNVLVSSFLRALVAGLIRSGQTEEAVFIIEDQMARIQEGEETFDSPELLRVRATVQLATGDANAPLSETSLLASVEQARRHGALAWELRSAIDLARVWIGQERTVDAAALLGGLQARFSEGFGTADLKSASLLMDHLVRLNSESGAA